MGRTACTEPQCLYKGALYLYLTVELYLYSPYGPYGLYRASVPVQGCTLPYFKHNGISSTKITHNILITNAAWFYLMLLAACPVAKYTVIVLQKLMVAQLVSKRPTFSGIHIYLLW